MIIDLHSHFNGGTKGDSPDTNFHKKSLDFILKEYDYCGIKCGGFTYFSAVHTNESVFEDNLLLFNQAKTNDRVYQWVVLDPTCDKTFIQVEEMLKSPKTLGIKIHSPLHKYDIESYADKIFSFANDVKAFVLMHPDNIDGMVKYANKYKDMKLIIAHLGSEAHIDAIKNAKHGNIFTDTSAGGMVSNNGLEYAVSKIGSEKIFFGTDTYACGYQIGRITYARISNEDKENIFYKNAISHFNIK